MEYLRNVLVTYLGSADPVARERMEPGIFMALRLGEAEVEGIRRKRKEDEERVAMETTVGGKAASWWGGGMG